MKLDFHSPVLFVEDIDISKKFYMEVLGQEIEYDFGANILFKNHLSIWQISDEHEISRTSVKSDTGNKFELYFETNNIQETESLLNQNNIRFLHHIKTESWGQMTMRFFDPDGHLIEIGESLQTFVTRIYSETGSVSETAAKTGVALSDIKKVLDSRKISGNNRDN